MILYDIEITRLKWYGDVQRMPKEQRPKKITKTEAKKRGRPEKKAGLKMWRKLRLPKGFDMNTGKTKKSGNIL